MSDAEAVAELLRLVDQYGHTYHLDMGGKHQYVLRPKGQDAVCKLAHKIETEREKGA